MSEWKCRGIGRISVAFIVAALVAACSGTVTPRNSQDPRSTDPAAATQSASVPTTGVADLEQTALEAGLPPDVIHRLLELTWAAESGDGWYYGRMDGPTRLERPSLAAITVQSAPGRVIRYTSQRDVPVVAALIDTTSGSASDLLTLPDGESFFRIVVTNDGSTAYYHSSSDTFDHGVRRLDLSDPESSSNIVAGGSTPQGRYRAELKISPDDRLVGSALCDLGSCTIDVGDLEAGVILQIADRTLVAASGSTLLLGVSDGNGTSVRDVERDSEVTLPPWQGTADQPEGAPVSAAIALEAGRFALSRTSLGRYDITLVDAASGTEKLLWTDPDAGELPALDLIRDMRPIDDWVWLSGPAGAAPEEPLWGLNVRDATLIQVGTFPALAD